MNMKNLTHRIMVAALICGGTYLNVYADAPSAQPSDTLTFISSESKSKIYSFNYPSVNADGNPIVLSSALIAWTPNDRDVTDSIESVHIFNHITIGADKQRPSTTSPSGSIEQQMLKNMPARQYITPGAEKDANYVARCIIIAPDYEGYGASKDVPHPYLSQELTARQVADAATYGLELYRKVQPGDADLLPIKSDWRSFCMGFSQGGAVALATQRYLEESGLDKTLNFKGSICGDGPYDLIATIRYYYEDDGTSFGVQTAHTKGKATLPVVMPLIIKGMHENHPAMQSYEFADFMSQQLIDTGVLQWIDSKEYTNDDMVDMWEDQLKNGIDSAGVKYTPEQMADLFTKENGPLWGKLDKMISPQVHTYLSNPDNYNKVPTTPTNAPEALHRALADNSVSTGWEPKHRIIFYHSKNDMVVPYSNYLAFHDAHPEGENTLYKIDDTFSQGDHTIAGTQFFIRLVFKYMADDFNWLSEEYQSTEVLTIMPENNPAQGKWYDLLGNPLNGMPTNKGIYFYNNIKVIIP